MSCRQRDSPVAPAVNTALIACNDLDTAGNGGAQSSRRLKKVYVFRRDHEEGSGELTIEPDRGPVSGDPQLSELEGAARAPGS